MKRYCTMLLLNAVALSAQPDLSDALCRYRQYCASGKSGRNDQQRLIKTDARSVGALNELAWMTVQLAYWQKKAKNAEQEREQLQAVGVEIGRERNALAQQLLETKCRLVEQRKITEYCQVALDRSQQALDVTGQTHQALAARISQLAQRSEENDIQLRHLQTLMTQLQLTIACLHSTTAMPRAAMQGDTFKADGFTMIVPDQGCNMS